MSFENPYKTPSYQPSPALPPLPEPRAGSAAAGWASQVRVVAILLIVHGSLMAMVGLMFLVMGVLMGSMITFGMPEPSRRDPSAPPEFMGWIMFAVHGGGGLFGVFAGGLQIFAGVKNLSFRGKTLGIVAMIGGMISLVTCYCLPTAIALAVYGLIVYLNPATQHAFALGERGYGADQILASLYRDQPLPGEKAF